MAGDERTFVVIGAGLAGAKAVETLREEGFTGRVVLVGAEADLPYERPPLSKGYLAGTQERSEAFVHDRQWYDGQRIDLVLGHRATAIDPAAHTVTVVPATVPGHDGHGVLAELLHGPEQDADRHGETIRYDKLLLATGSRVRRLDVPGADLPDVRYLRVLPDADALRDRFRGGGCQVLVVGAGWIGLEVAAAARRHGCAVTVVEPDRLPLRRVLGDEVAAIFQAVHEAHGVRFRFGTGVREFGGDSAGRLTDTVLDDGAEVPADLVVAGIGVRPEVGLAVGAGLAVARRAPGTAGLTVVEAAGADAGPEAIEGVAVDASLRTSDPDIYACGDCAAWHHPLLDTRIRVEHWANALDGGPAAARAMVGRQVSYDRVPYFFSDQYDSPPMIGMEYAGYVGPDGYDRVVFRGDPTVRPDADPEFLAFWVREGRVLAGMNVNVWDVNETIQDLVRAGWQGRTVDLDRLADPDVPLERLLA